jgi:hypothetical protein
MISLITTSAEIGAGKSAGSANHKRQELSSGGDRTRQ